MTKAKKGHWPKGKRRNIDRGDWGITLTALAALLDHHHAHGRISIGALAKAIGTYPKTVWRWLHGIDRPDPETQEKIGTWTKQRRQEVKDEAIRANGRTTQTNDRGRRRTGVHG